MTQSNRSKLTRFLRSLSGVAVAILVASSACSEAQTGDITGETHFLKRCDVNAADCGGSLACVCGVCTRECTVSSNCSAYPPADCITTSASQTACEGFSGAARCDVSCGTDADCRSLSASHRCEAGFCRTGSSGGGTGGTGGTAGTGGTGGDAGAGGADACVTGEVSGNQVVVLGDTFMALTHEVTAGVEELARAAGALPAGQRYRDESTSLNNSLALGGNGIRDQYERAVAEGSVAVVIMNGGGADVLNGTCADPPDASCPDIAAAVTAASELFQQMATDGVAHVVYAFYPDAMNTELRAKMDVIRPLLAAACSESPAPCHFVDLRPTFEGRYDEFITPAGLNPTAAGSEATAGAIWATMQQYCVAQ